MQGSVFKTVLSEIVQPLVKSLKASSAFISGTRFDNPQWALHAHISCNLINRIQLLEQVKKANWLGGENQNLSSPRAQMFDLLQPRTMVVGAAWNSYSGAYGIEIRDPTMDKRLLEFCVGVPTEQFIGKGYSRFLMRRAMQGLLPKQVQWNVKKGVQAADLGERLRQTAPEVEAALLEIKLQPNVGNYLDLNRLESTWQRLKHHNPEKLDANSLLRAISMGLFLLQFEDCS